jgi:hypothetical protein
LWEKFYSPAVNPTPPTVIAIRESITPNTEPIEIKQMDVVTSNWAGVIAKPPPGEVFHTIVGTWLVPNPVVLPTAPDGKYSISAWVSLESGTIPNRIAAVGTTISCDVVNRGVVPGSQQVTGWYQYDATTEELSIVPIEPGNKVSGQIYVTPTGFGFTSINLKNLSNPSHPSVLVYFPGLFQAKTAQWLVGKTPPPLVSRPLDQVPAETIFQDTVASTISLATQNTTEITLSSPTATIVDMELPDHYTANVIPIGSESFKIEICCIM